LPRPPSDELDELDLESELELDEDREDEPEDPEDPDEPELELDPLLEEALPPFLVFGLPLDDFSVSFLLFDLSGEDFFFETMI